MAKDQKIGVMWKLLFGTVTCLSFALPALSDSSKLTKTSCPGEFSKQSTLPTSLNCSMVRLPNGTMLQTVPKLFSTPAVFAGKIPGQHIICRIPDCGRNLCKNGWCEETMVGYNCTCSSGFQGKHCDEQSTEEATNKPTTSPSTTMTERSDTTTSQNTTTSAKTKSATSPTATMPERSDATTSRETTTSKSVESSTTDVAAKTATRPMTTVSASTTSPETTASNSTELSTADATSKPTTSPTTMISDTSKSQDTTTSKSTEEATNKPTTSPTTTMTERSDTTTSQSTTTSACSSPPVDCKFGGSFYNFSTSEMNHSSAVLACSQYGSHLVFIESLKEQDFIVGRASGDYWIGLTGLSLSEARWLDGSTLTYSNFTQGSFHENVNCFRIYVHVHSGNDNLQYSWQDRDCSIQFRFICEKEVGI